MPPEENQSTPVDQTQNLKAEFDRKLANIQQQLAASQEQLLSMLQAAIPTQPTQSQTQESYDLFDADGQKKLLTDVDRLVESKIENAVRQYEDRTIQQHQIYSEYPELQDPNNVFTQEVTQRYQGLSQSQKKDPMHFQTILYQTAAKHGLQPKQFRKSPQETEDFSLSGGKGERVSTPKKPKSGEVSPETMAWVEVLKESGAPIDPENEAQMAKLAELAQRKSWNKFSTSPTYKRGGTK
jgi:hypothetical protein